MLTPNGTLFSPGFSHSKRQRGLFWAVKNELPNPLLTRWVMKPRYRRAHAAPLAKLIFGCAKCSDSCTTQTHNCNVPASLRMPLATMLTAEWFKTPMLRTIRVSSNTFGSLLFVDAIIAFAPDNCAIWFKSQYVCGNSIKEPAIMAHDNRTAAKIGQAFFQSSQGIDVQVFGRFVKKHEITARSK